MSKLEYIIYPTISGPAAIDMKREVPEATIVGKFPWAGWPQACGEGVRWPCLLGSYVENFQHYIPRMTLTPFPPISFQKFLLSILDGERLLLIMKSNVTDLLYLKNFNNNPKTPKV